ncbi:MAG: hypothetical protein Q7T18_02430, partial [Sedimentisphaerales bacterium]|nr:hypothetical protein [Sedimentisphaerales bacterium]
EQIVETLDGVVDKDGKVVFRDVPCGDHAMGVVSALHLDMNFGASPMSLIAGAGNVAAEVQVFDISYDPAKLLVHSHHLMIKAQQDSFLITEYVQLENSSDMAISSKEKDSKGRPIILKTMLPKGFKNFNSSGYFDENALAFTDDGFYDTMAIPPGEQLIIFSYTLDIPSDTANIVKKISLPTSSVVVFADLNNAKIEGLGTPSIATNSQGTPMEFYTLNNLAANSDITLRITGLHKGTSGTATWMILAGVFFAISIVAIMKLRSRKTPQESPR